MTDDEAVKKTFNLAWQMVLEGTGDKIEPVTSPKGYVLGNNHRPDKIPTKFSVLRVNVDPDFFVINQITTAPVFSAHKNESTIHFFDCSHFFSDRQDKGADYPLT